MENSTSMDTAPEPEICEPGFGSPLVFGGSGGILVPVGGDWEANWPDSLQAILYFLGLTYCLAGARLIADIFLTAIETLRAHKKLVRDGRTGRQITRPTWGNTLVNQTLLDLGSCAPEIVLNLVEILSNSMHSGDLGPSVIVGSAAFNVFVSLGICVSALPEGQTRKLNETSAVALNAGFFFFSYLWLLLILAAPPTPDVVDITEGLLTIFWLPVLIAAAFVLDKGYIKCLKTDATRKSGEFAEARTEILRMYGFDLPEEHISELLRLKFGERPTRAQYRINATRTLTAGRTVHLEDTAPAHKKLAESIRAQQAHRDTEEGSKTLVSFPSEKYCCVKSDGRVLVPVVREGDLQTTLRVRYHTEEGTAREGQEYEPIKNTLLVFQPGETLKKIEIRLIVDHVADETEEFYIHLDPADMLEEAPKGSIRRSVVEEAPLQAPPVEEEKMQTSVPEFDVRQTQEKKGNKLQLRAGDPDTGASNHPEGQGQDAQDAQIQVASPDGGQAAASRDGSNQLSENPDGSRRDPAYRLGKVRRATVVIFDRDDPGVLAFTEEQIHVRDDSGAPFQLDVVVERRGGGCGRVSCSYYTEEGTALEDSDFRPTRGTLTMDEDVMRAVIPVTIMPKGTYEGTEHFRMILKDTQGTKFDGETDGGVDSNILTIFIDADPNNQNKINSLMRKINVNYDRVQLGHRRWRENFREAVYVGGSPEAQRLATVTEFTAHILLLPWKLLFAIVPPTDYMWGWLTFGCALVMMGIVTALISDTAHLLGCVLGIPTEVTGVTLVAIGTSMPDTLAAVRAARWEASADTCVGTLTGSKSASIFLGLGLPWSIGAVYWSVVGAAPGDDWYEMASARNWPRHVLRDHQGAMVVVGGSFSTGVAVFAAFAFAALALLVLRRRGCGGELGGPKVHAKLSTAVFLSLWLTWIIIVVSSIVGWLSVRSSATRWSPLWALTRRRTMRGRGRRQKTPDTPTSQSRG